VIVLDTHAAIWAANDDPALGKHSRSMVRIARAEGRLRISAISAWEIALLVSKDRLALADDPGGLWLRLLASGVNELPVTSEIAFVSVGLEGLHNDPADRFIAATTIVHNATLMTADMTLLRWRHPLKRQNAAK
jgi:PIN domain nuclease of toxin-antitoxin system